MSGSSVPPPVARRLQGKVAIITGLKMESHCIIRLIGSWKMSASSTSSPVARRHVLFSSCRISDSTVRCKG
ncbi:hypothetical protein MLD38_032476 [Melastoma candidum]|uniref:Uncharacterized protein n=1 Tax=Melastoma candidum TaxID=119954 RepID=A0ACB9M3K8_9MYRT|nr:hypothetical protein MLD38_032476 [Melastoma candidum]